MHRWFNIALVNLVIAAVIGAVLRAYYLWEVPFFRFKALLNAHSHVAMLGWTFIAMVVFLLKDERTTGPSRLSYGLLVATQVAVTGMLVGFPFQTYGPFIIAVGTLHMVVSYWLGARIWKATHTWRANGSRLLVRMAIIMMVLSTVGTWGMWRIIDQGGFGTELYYWSIQFYLHFQLNGWFWFGALALWSRWAETHGARYVMDRFTIWLWVVSALLTFALAIAWSERHWAIYSLNSIGVVLQFWAGWRTARSIIQAQRKLVDKAPLWAWRCVTYALIGMGLKVLMQAAVAIPQVAVMAFTVRNFTIGFIHLNTLGCITMMLFAMALIQGWFRSTSATARIGLSVFTAGFILSEAILFLQGSMFWFGWGKMPGYYTLCFALTALLPIGVIILWWHAWRMRRQGRPAPVAQPA